MSSLSSTTRGTLALIVDFFMMLYAMFFFLIDGRRYLDSILRYLPLRESEQEQMLQRFVSVTRATIKGTLLIGIVQGTLGGVMFADPRHLGRGALGIADDRAVGAADDRRRAGVGACGDRPGHPGRLDQGAGAGRRSARSSSAASTTCCARGWSVTTRRCPTC